MNTTTRALVLPLISAGILAGALGFAGTAAAGVTTHHTNGSHSIVATPDTKAKPANGGMRNWYQMHGDLRAQMGW